MEGYLRNNSYLSLHTPLDPPFANDQKHTQPKVELFINSEFPPKAH